MRLYLIKLDESQGENEKNGDPKKYGSRWADFWGKIINCKHIRKPSDNRAEKHEKSMTRNRLGAREFPDKKIREPGKYREKRRQARKHWPAACFKISYGDSYDAARKKCENIFHFLILSKFTPPFNSLFLPVSLPADLSAKALASRIKCQNKVSAE